MKFENPDIDEDINISKEHPLKEFFQLLAGVSFIIVIVMILLSHTAQYFARKIPFSYESSLLSHVDSLVVKKSDRQQKLQDLANRLSQYMDLPGGMNITVHYSEEDTVNAYATLGGHVFFFRGLVEKMPSENALAMVMAHEIAHIKYRHPIVAMGKGVTMLVLAASVSGASGSSAGEALINESLNLGLLKYSRDQESESDVEALRAIQQMYGNVQGAKELFDVLNQQAKPSTKLPELFLSHPHTDKRWEKLKQIALENGWVIQGQTTPLIF